MGKIITKYKKENKGIITDNRFGKTAIDVISKPFHYLPSEFGFNNKLTGEGVKVAIIDSGCPKHSDITNIVEKVSFCESEKGTQDKFGHATLVSGILGANNKKTIMGISPNIKLYFSKVMNASGECSFNALVAGVLWSIAKEVDVIVMALGTEYDYPLLHDAIEKAHKEGICLFAASGNKAKYEVENVYFPARYSQCFSVGALTRSDKLNRVISQKVDFVLPAKSWLTTYLHNKYIKVSGSSISTALIAGLAALLIEKYKKINTDQEQIPKQIYHDLLKTI